MNNEHNPVSQLVTRIQQKWREEISASSGCRLFRWMVKEDEMRLHEGFLRIESTAGGAVPEIVVAMLTPFATKEGFSSDLMKSWFDACDEDKEHIPDKEWKQDYYRSAIHAEGADARLLQMLTDFYKAAGQPDRKMAVCLMPLSLDDLGGYIQWLKSLLAAGIPDGIVFCVYDYAEDGFLDDAFKTGDTRTVSVALDLSGAMRKLAQAGDPNAPDVQLRGYLIKMSDRLSRKDLSGLRQLGNECIAAMARSKIRPLMAAAYIIYGGMLFQFREYDQIEDLLRRGLAIAGASADDITCRSLVPQFEGYMAANFQLKKDNRLAAEWFCRQARSLAELGLPAPAISAYRNAAVLTKNSDTALYRDILQKGFELGDRLKEEEVAYTEFPALATDYHNTLSHASS